MNTKVLKISISILIFGAIHPIAFGQVNQDFHKICLQAKDYAGCVRVMKGEDSIKIDQTNREGLRSEVGNSCPSGYGYAGGGQCRSIKCAYLGIWGKHTPELAGKGHSCPDQKGFRPLFGSLTMFWGDLYMKPIADPKCPQTEPGIGEISSCSSINNFKPLQDLKD